MFVLLTGVRRLYLIYIPRFYMRFIDKCLI